MSEARPNQRAGFTLVELLMVILIIALLMALLLPAINAVRVTARETSMKVDLDQIANALQKAKAAYGGHPASSYWHDQEIVTFLRRAFPRYQATASDITILADPQRLSAAEALVFWLGGIYDGTRMTGFSADPRNPLAGPNATYDLFGKGVVTQRKPPLFDFDETRLADLVDDNGQPGSNGFPEYYPPNTSNGRPYVYFAARPNNTYWRPGGTAGSNQGTGPSNLPFYLHPNTSDNARPYLSNPTPAFVESDGFQIILAGIDNEYESQSTPPTLKYFPSGVGYTPGDADNMVSFTSSNLGEARQ